MSLPKIGSVTVWVGENGTRLIHSSSVSQAPDTAPATPSARSTAKPAMTHVPIGTRSGTSSPSNVSVMPPPDGRPPGAPNDPNDAGRALAGVALGLALGLGEASGDGPEPAGPFGIGRRHEPVREQQVAEQDDQRDEAGRDEQARLGAEPGPEHAVEADALVPDGVGPEVDARGRKDEEREDRDDADAEPGAAHDRAERRRPGPVIRAADGAPGGSSGGGVPALRRRRRREVRWGSARRVRRPRPLRRPRPRRRARRRRRRRPVGLGLVVVVVRRTVGVAGRPVRVVLGRAAFRLGAASLELAHELVEQVAHRAESRADRATTDRRAVGRPRSRRSGPDWGGIRAGPGPRRIARTRRAPAPRSGSGEGSRRGPAPSGTRRGPRAGSATGGRRRRAGRAA